MTTAARKRRSEYMEWAKTQSQATYNLATSGIMNVPISEFPLRVEDLEVTTSSSGYGYPPLQERLARHTGVPEECIVAATGTSMANHLAMAAILNPGDEVVIEHPAYGPLLDVASYLGARVKRIARRRESAFMLDLDEIAAAIAGGTRLVVLTNLHNPSGALVSAEMLHELGKIAQRGRAQILVDEVYLEMLFDPDAPFAFRIGQGWGSENPFIVTSSLTKLHGLSGLRCGWILSAPDLAHRIWLLNDLFGSVAVHSAERMAVVAFDRLAQFRERARMLLVENRQLLDAFLDSRDDLECFRPPAGTVVFPRLREGDTEAFVRLLRTKYDTSVVPGAFFEMPDHIRIGIGGATSVLQESLQRLGAALDEFGNR